MILAWRRLLSRTNSGGGKQERCRGFIRDVGLLRRRGETEALHLRSVCGWRNDDVPVLEQGGEEEEGDAARVMKPQARVSKSHVEQQDLPSRYNANLH